MDETVALPWLYARALDQSSDPRISSTRNDSSGGGTISAVTYNKSSSAVKLVVTFIPVAVFFVICLLIFLCLRPRLKRVYAPRTIKALRYPEVPSPELPSGWFNWIIPFFRIPDTFILNHGSIDGFFFLRYLKVIRNICLVGCLLTYPILFPINATGGRGNAGLDMLTIGNVADHTKLYAHLFVAWAFFGFVIFTIVRECIYYVNVRQAYLSSPHYAKRISSKTMLITCIPKEYQDEARLRKLYGDSAKKIYIPRSTKELAKLVKEREQTALRLENAEIALIRSANLARKKYLRSHPNHSLDQPPETDYNAGHDVEAETAESEQELAQSPSRTSQDSADMLQVNLPGPGLLSNTSIENIQSRVSEEVNNDEKDAAEVSEQDLDYTHPYGLHASLPDLRGSVAAQWIPAEKRPHHRPIGNFFRRVDTIRWTRMRIKELSLHIFKARKRVRRGEAGAVPAAFIEFDTQESAHAAQQVLAHHRPLQMSSRTLGIRPDEVIWSSLRMFWWELIMRRTAFMGIVLAMVVFWSLPSAFIGLISNLDKLRDIKFIAPFLSWIDILPDVIVRAIEGLLPAAALTLLMAIVPIMLRFFGRQSGLPSMVRVELFVQNSYFTFQVFQVFLITTLSSALSSSLTEVIQAPLSAKDLLAKSLPSASNFYLSYILIQCAASGGINMLQVFDFLRHVILQRLTNNPRKRFWRWRKLRMAPWGALFPVYSNMGVIALSYACIAPLVLIFAAGGIAIIQMVWKYNLIFVIDSTHDSRGLFYPQALLHLIVGLYLAEVCLIGLFALNSSFPPVVLMLIFLLFTILVHLSLSDGIAPLLVNLPQTLSIEEDIQTEDKEKEERAKVAAAEEEAAPAGAANSYYDTTQAFGEEERQESEHGEDDEGSDADEVTVTNNRALEGSSSIRAAVTDWFKMSTKEKVKKEVEESGLKEWLAKVGIKFGDDNDGKPGFLQRFFHPEEHEDFVALRRLIPKDSLPNIVYPENSKYCDYAAPDVWMPKPTLWIPSDEARVSKQEVAHTRLYTPISDKGATLDEKGRVVVEFELAPCDEPRLLL